MTGIADDVPDPTDDGTEPEDAVPNPMDDVPDPDDDGPDDGDVPPAALRDGERDADGHAHPTADDGADRGARGIPAASRGERSAPPAGRDGNDAPAERGERIAKWLARAGVASRRDAEVLIADRLVTLNGRTVETPATFVGEGDVVRVRGTPVGAAEATRLFRYHKPDGLVTTHRDPQGRPTVFDALPTGLPRLVSVGRLDLTSEGLLLLTNDGALARKLELPANGWLRRYRVRVNGAVDESRLAALARGVTVEGVAYGPIAAGLDSRRGANAWLTVSLQEGKNREVRRVMSALHLHVTRLIRVAYGPFQLGALPRGAVEEVNARTMREQLGLATPNRILRGTERTPLPPDTAPPRTRPPRARNAGGRRS